MNVERLIERTELGVFGSLRSQSLGPMRISCSVTRTFPSPHVEARPAQPDDLAPAHPRVEREVDERAVGIGVCLGKCDTLLEGEELHLAKGHARRLHAIARIRHDLLLLNRDLQHAAEQPVVTVDGARRVARVDLVHQPPFDLVRREMADAVVAKAGKDVELEIASIYLLGCWGQPARQREKLVCPLRECDLSGARIEPTAAVDRELHLAEEPLRVGLAKEGARLPLTAWIGVARAVLSVALCTTASNVSSSAGERARRLRSGREPFARERSVTGARDDKPIRPSSVSPTRLTRVDSHRTFGPPRTVRAPPSFAAEVVEMENESVLVEVVRRWAATQPGCDPSATETAARVAARAYARGASATKPATRRAPV